MSFETNAPRAAAPQSLPLWRILVVDDNPSIHRDFQKILCTHQEGFVGPDIGLATEPAHPAHLELTVDFASQGEEGLQRILDSIRDRNPYMLAFIDVRMPPGWDGIETTAKIWAIDPDLQVVLCTAYSDYSWHDLALKLNRPDKFLVLKKPFDVVEVQQLVHAFARKRELRRMLAERTNKLERSERRNRTILNALPLPVFVFDQEVRLLDFNPAAEKMLEGGRDQVLRRPVGDALRCIHAIDIPGGCGHSPYCRTCVIRAGVERAVRGEPVPPRRTQLAFQNGRGTKELEVGLTMAPIEFEGSHAALLIFEDVTELVTLRGLLPVCSRCRSVRDDQQYWHSLEAYLRSHLQLGFSYGLCPKCTEEMYPDLYLKMKGAKTSPVAKDFQGSDPKPA